MSDPGSGPAGTREDPSGCGAGSPEVPDVRSTPFDLGNGSRRAAPKITTITAIRTRFATETVKMDQCRYRPGLFICMAEDTRLAEVMNRIL